jgi:1-acyl-sn-glycerol-3-phosphate acyltransferase
VFGPALRAAGHIAIDRTDRSSAVTAYARAAEVIRQGVRAVIFAEGTRSRTGRLQPFKKGPFVLAILAQVPVVPVFIEGTFAVLPKGARCPRPGPITVHIGAPIPTDGLTYEDRDALVARARAAMVALGAREEREAGTQTRDAESAGEPPPA